MKAKSRKIQPEENTTESELEAKVRYDVEKHFGMRADVFLYPNPVGCGWVGKAKEQKNGGVVIDFPRRVDYGLKVGSSDLIGYFIYKGMAIFLCFELKSPTGRATPEQLIWIDNVKKHGGIAGIVRSVADAEKLISNWVKARECDGLRLMGTI